MNPELLNSINSIPDPLTLDDILQNSESQGLDWKLLKSSLAHEGFAALSSSSAFNSKLRESLSQLKEQVKQCNSPQQLDSAMAHLPLAEPAPPAAVESTDLRQQLEASLQQE